MEEDEARAIRDVQERLRARFPHLEPRHVDAAVTGAYASLTGPVRAFVPVLVERAALEQLAKNPG